MSASILRLQALVERGCQDCVSVERTHDPEHGWVWVLHDCSLGKPFQSPDFDALERTLTRAQAAESPSPTEKPEGADKP